MAVPRRIARGDRRAGGDRARLALPGVDDGTAVPARSLAALLLAGGALLAVLIAVPHGWHFDVAVAAAAAGLGLAGGAVVGVLGSRLPNRALHPVLVAGALLGSAVLLTGTGNPLVVAAASLYVGVALYAFRFFALPVALAYLVGIAAVLAVVLARTDHSGAWPGEWLLTMATCVTVGVVIVRVRTQLWRVAMTDALTGLPNRQCLDRALEHLIASGRGPAPALSVAMIDLDGFKAVNDRRGHAAGDACLRDLARRWQADLRRPDLLARYGGDEFVVVLPATAADDAAEIVARLRPVEGLQLSVGLATLGPGDDAAALLARADAAMYERKRSKRRAPADQDG